MMKYDAKSMQSCFMIKKAEWIISQFRNCFGFTVYRKGDRWYDGKDDSCL